MLSFEEFYVIDENSPDKAAGYIGDAKHAVIYIDISEFWSSGYDDEAVLQRLYQQLPYDSAQLLYQNGLSVTYLISR